MFARSQIPRKTNADVAGYGFLVVKSCQQLIFGLFCGAAQHQLKVATVASCVKGTYMQVSDASDAMSGAIVEAMYIVMTPRSSARLDVEGEVRSQRNQCAQLIHGC